MPEDLVSNSPDNTLPVKAGESRTGFRHWIDVFTIPRVGAACIAFVGVYAQEKYLPIGNLVEHLGSTVIYCSSAIADMSSTKQGFIANDTANTLGWDPHVRDINPHLRNVTNFTEYQQAIKQKIVIAEESAMVAAAVLIPPLGVSVGVVRHMAAFNNRRQLKRINTTIEKLKERSKND
ncbi:MAG: hypothetical protein ABSB12_04040 [Candidatus Saccharimonadales bacterium]|jgi:hypothetical protein